MPIGATALLLVLEFDWSWRRGAVKRGNDADGRPELIRRRDLIAMLGGTTITWPLAASGQQKATPVIGFLSDATPESLAHALEGFHRGLMEEGFSEGRNLTIEYRWARGHYDVAPDLAADLVRRQVAAIVISGTEKLTRATMAATSTIPLVAMVAGDPVKRGLVASVNRPGGNLTVVSLFTFSNNALVAKRVELAHELAPKAAIVGWLVDTNILDYDDQLRDLQRASQALGLEVKIAPVATAGDLDAAFASLVRQGSGFILETGPIIFSNRAHIIALAAQVSVPMLYEWPDFVSEGGLMSYGTNRIDVLRQAGVYAGRILIGENVGDLPVVEPDKYLLVINLKTAKALGLTVPQILLVSADEVIE
jgi:putative ABC transport system substrate-binding protein